MCLVGGRTGLFCWLEYCFSSFFLLLFFLGGGVCIVLGMGGGGVIVGGQFSFFYFYFLFTRCQSNFSEEHQVRDCSLRQRKESQTEAGKTASEGRQWTTSCILLGKTKGFINFPVTISCLSVCLSLSVLLTAIWVWNTKLLTCSSCRVVSTSSN